MFKVYARTESGKIIQGVSAVASASEALERAHKSATANGERIVKATVSAVDGKQEFKVTETKAKGSEPATTGSASGASKGRGGKR